MKRLLSLIVLLALLAVSGGSGAQADWISLGTATVDEMFTERDFDPSYDKYEDIVLADGASYSESAGVRIDRDTVQITQEGVYRLSGSLSDGQIVVYAPEKAKVQLVLDGVDVSRKGSAAIYAVSADKVFITGAAGSVNTLRSLGQPQGDDIDGAIFAKVDICFNGEGSLHVESQQGHGIVTKDDLKICSGTYDISALKQGLSGKDSIRIGGGDIRVVSGGDALHSEHDSADKGFIFISGGNLSAESGKDGIDCTSYFSMLGGDVSISADSDGINVAAADDRYEGCFVSIRGGTLRINAVEDGIDSNGSLGISGGEVYISAAPLGGDGALDYGRVAEISGGTLVAASSHMMAANFTQSEAQGSMLCCFEKPHKAGEQIRLVMDGADIVTFTPELDYQAVVISTPTVVSGGIYTVIAGDESVEISMSESLFSNGFGPMGHSGRPMLMPPAGERPPMPRR